MLKPLVGFFGAHKGCTQQDKCLEASNNLETCTKDVIFLILWYKDIDIALVNQIVAF